MFEEILQTVSFPQEESGALFPPLCKNTDMRYEECDCEECRPTKDALDGLCRERGSAANAPRFYKDYFVVKSLAIIKVGPENPPSG